MESVGDEQSDLVQSVQASLSNLQLRCKRPQGAALVCAVEARNLRKKDVGVLQKGKSDPYVVLSVGAQQHRSKTINNVVNAKWHFNCQFIVAEEGETLNVFVYDHDTVPHRGDEFLGRTMVELDLVREEGPLDVWLELEDVKSGEIHLKLIWLELSDNPMDLKSALIESKTFGLASALLSVHLDSAKLSPSREGGKLIPTAVLSVGETEQKYSVKSETLNPQFDHVFHFLVRNPLTDMLVVKLEDRETGAGLGMVTCYLGEVYGLPGMKMEKEDVALGAKSAATITFTMELSILKLDPTITLPKDFLTDELPNEHPTVRRCSVALRRQSRSSASGSNFNSQVRASGDFDICAMRIRLTIKYSLPTKELIIIVHTVTNLPIENEELPDPYVKLHILPDRIKKQKTEFQVDQCNPIYDQQFEFHIPDLRWKILHVQVCDKKYIRSSRKLGEVYIPLDGFEMGESVTTWFPLSS